MTLTLIGEFRIGVLTAIPLMLAAPTLAQSRAQLPISEGFWVQADQSCGAASEAYVYAGNQFGSISHYGGQRFGQQIERVDRVGASTGGFTRYYNLGNGSVEVAARPSGQAEIRSYSYASGEVFWSKKYRQCPVNSLPAGLRGHAERLGLVRLTSAGAVGAAAARASAAPSSNPQAVTVNLQFSPRAKAALAANKTVTLRARYIGEPLPARRAQAEAADLVGEDDYIMVGNVERKVPANDGLITLAPANFSRQHAGWVKTLLVSIDSLDHPPSVRCDAFLERPLAAARAQPVTISCR